MSPRRLALAAAAAAVSLLAAAPASATPLVDLALSAKASTPAVNDGNAATTACSPEVTVDLGRTQRIEGFGVSLAGDSASGHVTIEAGGRRLSADVPVGTPAWLATRALDARRVVLR